MREHSMCASMNGLALHGGVLPFDVRDRNIVESSAGKKALAKLDGKFVYDPFEDNYKFIKIIINENIIRFKILTITFFLEVKLLEYSFHF